MPYSEWGFLFLSKVLKNQLFIYHFSFKEISKIKKIIYISLSQVKATKIIRLGLHFAQQYLNGEFESVFFCFKMNQNENYENSLVFHFSTHFGPKA